MTLRSYPTFENERLWMNSVLCVTIYTMDTRDLKNVARGILRVVRIYFAWPT